MGTAEIEYEKRNLSGFEGDNYLKEKFQQIIADHKIELVIELGTYIGGTTKVLSGMVQNVITVEANSVFYARAVAHLEDVQNVVALLGKSEEHLPTILLGLQGVNTLIFVDSHWEDLPLLKELEIIAKAGIQPVIIIHDFKVPDHPELGYDSYNGQDIDYDLIKDYLPAIYPDGFDVEYNSEATGAARGVCFVYPKTKIA